MSSATVSNHPVEPSAPLPLEAGHCYNPSGIRSALLSHGAVLLRGFQQTLADFEALADELMTPLVHHSVAGMEREPVNEAGTSATVNKGDHAIPLHRELSYAPGTPDLLMFYCEQQPASGGATTVCDGVALLDRLGDEARAFVGDRKLVWNWSASPARWRSTLGVTTVQQARNAIDVLNRRPGASGRLDAEFDGDTLHGRFTTSFLTKVSGTGRGAFCNSLLISLPSDTTQQPTYRPNGDGASACLDDGTTFPEPLLRVIAAEAAAVTHELIWQRGDIVLLDNARYMHGRRRITGSERRIITRVGHLRSAK